MGDRSSGIPQCCRYSRNRPGYSSRRKPGKPLARIGCRRSPPSHLPPPLRRGRRGHRGHRRSGLRSLHGKLKSSDSCTNTIPTSPFTGRDFQISACELVQRANLPAISARGVTEPSIPMRPNAPNSGPSSNAAPADEEDAGGARSHIDQAPHAHVFIVRAAAILQRAVQTLAAASTAARPWLPHARRAFRARRRAPR